MFIINWISSRNESKVATVNSVVAAAKLILYIAMDVYPDKPDDILDDDFSVGVLVNETNEYLSVKEFFKEAGA